MSITNFRVRLNETQIQMWIVRITLHIMHCFNPKVSFSLSRSRSRARSRSHSHSWWLTFVPMLLMFAVTWTFNQQPNQALHERTWHMQQIRKWKRITIWRRVFSQVEPDSCNAFVKESDSQFVNEFSARGNLTFAAHSLVTADHNLSTSFQRDGTWHL